MEGYNWEKNESNMWPAMFFHSDIKTHVYKSAKENKDISIKKAGGVMCKYRLISWHKDSKTTLLHKSLC